MSSDEAFTKADSQDWEESSINEVVQGWRPLDLEVMVRGLESHLESLREVPAQMQGLKDVPKQLVTVVSMLNRIDAKLDGSKPLLSSISDSQNEAALPSTNGFAQPIVQRQTSVSELSDLPSEAPGVVTPLLPLAVVPRAAIGASSMAASARRKVRIPSAMPSLARRCSLLQSQAPGTFAPGGSFAPGNLGHRRLSFLPPSVAQLPAHSASTFRESMSTFRERESLMSDRPSPSSPKSGALLSPGRISRKSERKSTLKSLASLPNLHEESEHTDVGRADSGRSNLVVSAAVSLPSSKSDTTNITEVFQEIDTCLMPGDLFPSLQPNSSTQRKRQGGTDAKHWGLSTNMQHATMSRLDVTRVGSESSNKMVMAPNSRARLIWDAMIVLSIVLVGTVIPLVLVYVRSRSSRAWYHALLYTLDVVWLIDIGFNFFTGFFVHGELVRNQRQIVWRYAERWLIPDILSACPLFLFNEDSDLFVVFSVLKLCRLFQINARFSCLRAEYSGECLPAEMLVVTALVSHLMACCWRLALRADGLSIDSEQGSVGSDYVIDLYYICKTLTSVGYGDVVPVGTLSRLYAIVIMLLGSVMFGAVVSLCSLFAQKLVNNEAENRVKELTRFMARRKVPIDLQRRVQYNLRQHFQFKASTAMSPHLLMSLSPAMQRELCLSILSNTVLNFPLFRNAQRSFVAELAQAHSWEQVLSGDLVTDEGQAVQEVVFVMHGSLQIWTPEGYADIDVKVAEWSANEKETHNPNTPSYCVEIESGAWFGESSLFDAGRVYTSLIVAITECELAVLAAPEYCAIVQKYPWLWKRHQKIEKGIHDGIIGLAALRYKSAMVTRSDDTTRSKTHQWFSSRFWQNLLPNRLRKVYDSPEFSEESADSDLRSELQSEDEKLPVPISVVPGQ